jgi:hypothetical protein
MFNIRKVAGEAVGCIDGGESVIADSSASRCILGRGPADEHIGVGLHIE